MAATPGLRGLLFDKDGTLFSFQATWGGWVAALIENLADGDRDVHSRLAQALRFDPDQHRFEQDSAVIAATEAEILTLMLPHLPGHTPQSLLRVLAESAAEVRPVQAVPLGPLLDRLRKEGYRLGVATNDGEAATRAQLERIGILDRFTFVAGYDSGHGAKPAPGPCLAFAEATGLEAAQVAMIGDSTHDLHAGRAAGMATVGVLTGPAIAADLQPFADAVLPDIGALPQWLGLVG